MLVTSPILSFESSLFPVAEGEDTATNPGIYGKALAEFLSKRLQDLHVPTVEPYAEDWGWCVELAGQKYPTGLACSSEDGEKTSWRVYAFVDLGVFGQFRGKDEAHRTVNDLMEKVRGVLSGEKKVTNLRSE